MKLARSNKLLRGACVLALLALALMVWSLFDPQPIAVILAMSLGQLLGTLSFAAFLVVVVRDLRGGSTRPSRSWRPPPPA